MPKRVKPPPSNSVIIKSMNAIIKSMNPIVLVEF